MLGVKPVEKEIAGQKFYLRPMNASANAIKVIELLPKVSSNDTASLVEAGALLVTCCLCDEVGKLLYPDVQIVKENSSIAFLIEFAAAALEVSGMTGEQPKNSPADQ